VIEDKDDLHDRMIPTQEPRRGAYGTTSLTSDQVLEILSKWRPPEKHWTDAVFFILLMPLNIWLVWHFIPVFAIIENTTGWTGFLSIFSLFILGFAFTAHFLPAFYVWQWFHEARHRRR